MTPRWMNSPLVSTRSCHAPSPGWTPGSEWTKCRNVAGPAAFRLRLDPPRRPRYSFVSGHILTAVPSSTDLSVRRLGPADLARCLALAEDRGWSREDRKWALMLELGETYGIEDDAGGLLGTTVLTRYGDQVAVIGMVLVASRVGGQGFGRRLMTHALDQA